MPFDKRFNDLYFCQKDSKNRYGCVRVSCGILRRYSVLTVREMDRNLVFGCVCCFFLFSTQNQLPQVIIGDS